MDDDKVNALVVFLSNPNRKAEEHVETVMAMTRELARYKHELHENRKESGMLRDQLNSTRGRDVMGFAESSSRYDYDPRHVTIPANARSVEIKF